MSTITLHVANTATGEYDVRRPLPKPFHVESETGEIGRQDYWRGHPSAVLGFNYDAEATGAVDILWADAVQEPTAIRGLHAVLIDDDGSISNMRAPITRAEVAA